jgi:hypothetical protein
MMGAAMKPGQMLTAAEAAGVLGVTSRDLADLVAVGLLRPCGSKGRNARRYLVTQVEALLNSPAGAPGARSKDALGPASPGDGGLARPVPASSGPIMVGSELVATCLAQPLSSVPTAQPDGASAHSGNHPCTSRDSRPVLLCALCQALPARAGPGLGCQLRQDGQRPHLLIRTASGAHLTVWLLWTSAGWRFLWNQWRSHTAIDLPGAATAIAADLASASATADLSPGSERPNDSTPMTGRAANGLSVSGRAVAQQSDPFRIREERT